MADGGISQKVGIFVMAGVFVVLAFFIGGALGSWSPFSAFGGEPYTEVSPGVVDSVRAVAQLTTVEMVEYTTVEKGNDRGWLNWASGDRIFLFAVAEIGAGVDLDRLYASSFEVDPDTGAVQVELPPAEITYVDVDEDRTQVYDRDTGLFTKGDPQLESDARAVAEDVLVQAALEHGILTTARGNAEEAIRRFLEGLGYTDITFVQPDEGA